MTRKQTIMYQIFFDGDKKINVELNLKNNQISGKIDNVNFSAELQQTHKYEYFIRYQNQSFNILLLKAFPEEKKLVLKINGKRVEVSVKDKFDLLLEQLGMDKLSHKKIDSIKAPMPGLVLDVLVSEGQAVKKGDTLLILEAMKMENALKSPADGVIKKVAVSKGMAVEKNQLLIEF